MANEVVETAKGKLVESVINRVTELTKTGGFLLPQNYNYENSLRAAFFIIGDTVDRNGKSALEVCTPASISEALFRMAAQGLDPNRSQAYFIIHGNKLTLRRSYMGSVAVARRVAGVKSVSAAVIHDGDGFTYEVVNGKYQNVKHNAPFENLDKDIIGAYCVATFEDGREHIDVMTIAQIKKSWKMSINQNSNKLQQDFSEEACKRTIIARCLKPLINFSDDSNLYEKQQDEFEENEVQETSHEVVTEKKNISLPIVGAKKDEPRVSKKTETVFVPAEEVAKEEEVEQVSTEMEDTSDWK